MSKQKVIICHSINENLADAISQCTYDKLFILVDEHTRKLCIPLIQEAGFMKDAQLICIGAEDVHKNLDTLAYVWKQLGDRGATRHSLLVNLGGGMVTDLGGFAASTFKRGIKYINVPTTLLAMVDASVGGKTGINFNGLKNEIGVFSPAESVLIDSEFLKSLDLHNLLSGYAEMLKHGLISTPEHWAELLNFDFNKTDYKALQKLVAKSVQIKEKIVECDPYETGIRKALLWKSIIRYYTAMLLPGEWSANYISRTSRQVFPKTSCARPSNSSKSIMANWTSTANIMTDFMSS